MDALMTSKGDGNLDMWVIGVIAATTLLGTACVVWFAWWWIVGRKLRTHPENHPWSEQVMRPTLKGETRRWQQQEEQKRKKAGVAVPAFMPLGLRIESEIVCGQTGSRV